MSAIETMVTEGFELEAGSALGLTFEPESAGFVIRWTSVRCGACAAHVESRDALRAWIRKHWHLFPTV